MVIAQHQVLELAGIGDGPVLHAQQRPGTYWKSCLSSSQGPYCHLGSPLWSQSYRSDRDSSSTTVTTITKQCELMMPEVLGATGLARPQRVWGHLALGSSLFSVEVSGHLIIHYWEEKSASLLYEICSSAKLLSPSNPHLAVNDPVRAGLSSSNQG